MTANTAANSYPFGWLSIMRLGLVQACLGAMVVLTTSTLNRVMVVELSLAAIVPGFLVGLHYAVQLSRPLFGHGSDVSKTKRSNWIMGGMALLALAGTGAAATTLIINTHFWPGFALACLAYILIGMGIGAAGTSLLALLASRTPPAKRPASATIVWIMMIAGIVMTAATTGKLLDPYSHQRLIMITAATGVAAVVLTMIALFRLERPGSAERQSQDVQGQDLQGHETAHSKISFKARLRETWADDEARLFTVFIFLSMLAYSTQDLILEPFAGLLFGMTPGQTTSLSGVQHGGILIGMVLVGLIGTLPFGRNAKLLKAFTITGCLGSAVALAGISAAAGAPAVWPLKANVMALGFFNGMFSIAAIGAMMTLAGAGGKTGQNGKAEGIRMGVWGAAQAIAFGFGGFTGTLSVSVTQALTGNIPFSYAVVFAAEACLFVVSALIAWRIGMGLEPISERGSATSRAQNTSILQPAE
jgi:BCD family chlorophyll transporter-like MFS transporter